MRNRLYKAGKKLYWSIPAKYRQPILVWAFKNFGFLFRGIPRYEKWGNSRLNTQNTGHLQRNLIDIAQVQPSDQVGGSIAIHIHIFYIDLIVEFANYLKNMPFEYDLYLSIPTNADPKIFERAFSGLPFCHKVIIKGVENRGRDIAPLFCAFGKELTEHKYFAHLHSKKSSYNKGVTEGWREYLCKNLLGSEERIRRIFTLMQSELHPFGIVYPQNYIQVPSWANTWLGNRTLGSIWCARLGIGDVPSGYFDYPVSSMFWARGDALAPLFNQGIEINDFPEEREQTDGTLSHCLERMFALCSQKQGLPPGIVLDDKNPSWSAWRFDQYTNRTYESLVHMFYTSEIKLIAFDIFDTLLSRPVLDPETMKLIVSKRVGREAGELYNEFRANAEEQAREAKGLDVTLDEIYSRLGVITKLSEERLKELRQVEEEVEKASLEPRQEVFDIYRTALATGKPVALISDMFLPATFIETCLRENGIDGWDSVFISNEIGLRKENGDLYRYVLKHYGITAREMVMVGDNERTDIQIPSDMGAAFLHLLRPVEFARGLPRFSALIARYEQSRNIDSEISLGLVVRKNFSQIRFPEFDPDSLVPVTPYSIGYSTIGPLLVSFAQWLIQKSQADGIDRLYFLSREGKLIKQVYDLWSSGEINAPQSDYLVISRRSAGVAAIFTLNDIFEIARTVYYSNTIENYLFTRYGIKLSDVRWDEINHAEGWNRTALVKVQGGKIEHLMPLLQALQSEIFARAEKERLALIRYTTEKGLQRDGRQAVVDVGYGGSVQGYLNKLSNQKVNGYYLMTDERSESIARTYHVMIKGCFYENLNSSTIAPIMFKSAFELEKLLSSDEGQIEYYEIETSGNARGIYRELLPEEIECGKIREPLQAGVMNYVDDARRIRDRMLPNFQPSISTAQMLVEAFFTDQSPKENYLLSKIVLDDYYCGLGLVSEKVSQE